jgi:dTDP-4-dehydrorhamnose 3,5-epimerase
MEIKKRKLIGVFEVTLKPDEDERGFFMRTYDRTLFRDAGIDKDWVQENHSRSERKGIIRGLHLQLPPYTETKLVRCIRGAVLDVFVDLRAGSETFGLWDSVMLSEMNKKMVLIPRGFAHGFCTLEEITEVIYKVDNYYNKNAECGLLWNDPDLAIDWPTTEPALSLKDRQNLTLTAFIQKYKSIRNE